MCINCSSLTDCHECEISLSMIIDNGVCVCRIGWVLIDGECLKCHDYCHSCYGITNLECTECASDAVTYIGFEDQKCLKDCPSDIPGTYLAPGINKCMNCYLDCQSCFGPSDLHCYTCHPPKLLFISSCHDTCPSSTFVDEYDLTCIKCPELCMNCIN